jgi:hypothetical protein
MPHACYCPQKKRRCDGSPTTTGVTVMLRVAGAGASVLKNNDPVRRHAAGVSRTQAELLKLHREGSGRAGAHPRACLRYLQVSGRRR